MVRTLSFLSALALLVLAPLGVSAQERTWSVSLVAEGGGLFPVRTLGKNSGLLPQLDDQQIIAEIDESAMWGAGVEVFFPGPMLRVRGMYHTTVNGASRGRIGVCGDPNDPLITGPVCEDWVTPATVESFSVDLSFVRASMERRFRPTIYLGGGVRQYTLSTVECPPPTALDIRAAACPLLNELWVEDGGLAPFVRFGAGMDVAIAGPVELRTSGIATSGRYPGGAGSADGHLQIDLMFNAGLAVKVF